jgi:hypothetical protein
MALPDPNKNNPDTKEPWKIGDTVVDNGVTYVWSGTVGNGSWDIPKSKIGVPGGDIPDGTVTGEDTTDSTGVFDSQPSVIFETEAKTTYDPATGRVAETDVITEPKSWYQALSFLSGLRGKESQAEYNRYVSALKKTPFWADNKSVEGAYKDALYSAAAQNISIQELLFKRKFEGVEGTGDGTTKANNLRSYKRAIERVAIDKSIILDQGLINSLAAQAIAQSWDSATLAEEVARRGKIDVTKGEAATQKATLKQWAADNGITFDEPWYDTAVTNIITGRGTADTYKADITNQAKGLYSAEYFTKGLDNGFSIRQQASPYITYLAKIRGVDPTSISLSDPILMKNLTKRDDKGNPVIPSYYDFTLDVRKNDPTWGYSYEAQEETTSMLNQFGKMFGKSW